jgi:hypothetical protein
MRVIVIAADYRPGLVERYLRECASGWTGLGGVKCFEPVDHPAGDPPESMHDRRFIMSDYLTADGSFAFVQMVKDLAVVLSEEPSVLVLDSTKGMTRYSDFDRHGIRAAEIPAFIAKTLYWMSKPPTVVHFVQPTMKPYFVREWGLVVEYAPVETPFVGGHDVAAVRIDPIWQRALAKRTIFTPRERLKRFLHRTVIRRIAKLIPRFSFFR